MGKQLGTFRAFFMVAVCCVGSFLFAYDTGIIGGVLTLDSFQKDFGYSAAQKTTVNSNANSLLQAGGESNFLSTASMLIFYSLFCLFLHMALHSSLWSSLVDLTCRSDLLRRRRPPNYQFRPYSGFLRCQSHIWSWSRYGNSDGSHVQRRDGP